MTKLILRKDKETELGAVLVALLRDLLPGAVVFRHEDKLSAGHPDISVTWRGRTVWIDTKLADPDLNAGDSIKVQAVNMLRLAGAGRARYVIYEDIKGIQRVIIAHPKHVVRHASEWKTPAPGDWSPGFDHRFVVEKIRELFS